MNTSLLNIQETEKVLKAEGMEGTYEEIFDRLFTDRKSAEGIEMMANEIVSRMSAPELKEEAQQWLKDLNVSPSDFDDIYYRFFLTH